MCGSTNPYFDLCYTNDMITHKFDFSLKRDFAFHRTCFYSCNVSDGRNWYSMYASSAATAMRCGISMLVRLKEIKYPS